MAFNLGGANPQMLVPDSPAVKRQKTASGYTSTSNSAQNTGAYNSDNDDGDELFANYVPDTPHRPTAFQTQPTQIIGNYHQTQPTQIVDRAVHPISNFPQAQQWQAPAPASSPYQQYSYGAGGPQLPPSPYYNAPSPVPQQSRPLAMSMAPAGTRFQPPHGIVARPAIKPAIKPAIINIEDSDEERIVGSSDEEDTLASANINPTHFSTSANNSFGASPTKQGFGNARFQSIVASAGYQPGQSAARRPQLQTRPERAKPIEDLSLQDVDGILRDKVIRLKQLFPNLSFLTAQNILTQSSGSFDRSVDLLMADDEFYNNASRGGPETITIDDDEIETPVKPHEPQMKRTLAAPVQSLRDKYSSTQALARAPSGSFSNQTPPKPKKRLVRGRKNPVDSSPQKQSSPHKEDSPVYESFDETDSGVESEEEEDPELEGRLLKFLNTCKPEDIIELTTTSKEYADLMVAARPFASLNAARGVSHHKILKSGKKGKTILCGDKIVDTATEMFQGYEAIDKLVASCGQMGKPLADEMATWGFDVFGQKNGELEMTSFERGTASPRDSGIGSPSSLDNSVLVDDDVKVLARKRTNVQLLKKPDLMAEDCVLKDYQVVGLNWLAMMYRHKLSAILADEMGLGKTCQVIAFISHLVETGNPGPHLVVCPGSTLENWLREFQRFAPKLMVEPYHGRQDERPEMASSILDNRSQVNVVVTTYDMAKNGEDNRFMRKLRPDVCVYDEGHMLKNMKSQRYANLVKITANFRLLLTGTPLQNNLQELAALLAFILPSVFKEVEDDLQLIFKAKATTSDANHAALLSAQRIARARSMLTPFVLRRKKTQVLKHLPGKTCRVEYCRLHKAQKVIYNGHIAQARERARARLEGVKFARSAKFDENNPLMQLRKAAIHPLLFRRHFTDDNIEKMADILRKKAPADFKPDQARHHLIAEMHKLSDFNLQQWCYLYPCIASFNNTSVGVMDSGKVEAMMKLVKLYKENGDRVLIFSQFQLVLDILESVLNSSLIVYTRIDGGTNIEARQTLIDNFGNDESITVFLLTTKAGGTGINLMFANKVIIFDGSFNPQDDRQAENRAHRVGQTREVEVVRLVTKGTVEEQIYALGQSKLELDGRVAGDDDAAKEAGEKEVGKMLLEVTDNIEVSEPEEEEEEEEKIPEPAEEDNKSDSSSELSSVQEDVKEVEDEQEETPKLRVRQAVTYISESIEEFELDDDEDATPKKPKPKRKAAAKGKKAATPTLSASSKSTRGSSTRGSSTRGTSSQGTSSQASSARETKRKR